MNNLSAYVMKRESFKKHYLSDVKLRFQKIKNLADNAIEQVIQEDLFKKIDEEGNSIAILMKHLSGNIEHNWTDVFQPYNEKPERDRDDEFIIGESDTSSVLFNRWKCSWKQLFKTIEEINAKELVRTVIIRWKDYTLLEAINRQLIHYSLHVGQIIFLAKHFKLDQWKTLSIPKGKSKEYNKKIRKERQKL